MTNQEAYKKTRNILIERYPINEASEITKLLFEEHFKIPARHLFKLAEEDFTMEEDLSNILLRLSAGEPIQYIIGYVEFDKLKIQVNKEVLIPRPETEELLEIIRQQNKQEIYSAIDICSGSGCLTLGLRKLFPTAKISGFELSRTAIELAKLNELTNFKDINIGWNIFDVLNEKWQFGNPDIVVCNPPYIARSEASQMEDHVLLYEPEIALFVDDSDSLIFYKKVVQLFDKTNFPKIYFELNPLTAIEFAEWCNNQKLICEILNDMSGHLRFAIVKR